MTADPNNQYSTKQEHKALENIVYFCLVVVAIGFIAIVISYIVQDAASIQSLSNQVQQQNSKIDTLTTIDTQILMYI